MTLSILDYYEVDENRVVSVILLVVQAGRQTGIVQFPSISTATSRMQDNIPINNKVTVWDKMTFLVKQSSSFI